MYTLQDTMPNLIDLRAPLLSGLAPSQEDNAPSTLFRNDIYDPLGELLPTFAGMTVRLMSSNGQACIQ